MFSSPNVANVGILITIFHLAVFKAIFVNVLFIVVEMLM
jgi:hypothetical protein